MFSKVFGGGKKSIERARDYPYYFSAQKRLNNFLNLPERNDIQKNILIAEPIEDITFKKLSFAYEEKKPVLKRLDLVFQKGKVNHLQGENGFGKSTIISLIMGLYQPNKGEILINNKHKLNEINLIKWREKIAYAEHENLIENGLSTGQKQLADLDNILITEKDKEIFIFDEADNALDEDNKKKIQEKIKELAKNKIVIYVKH
jgi:ABC-type bacteriocin/lantibiotic exporter with double-glycine peptidase domain